MVSFQLKRRELAPRQFAPGFWAENLGWVRAERIRQRRAN
jgi:hypothetical protein